MGNVLTDENKWKVIDLHAKLCHANIFWLHIKRAGLLTFFSLAFKKIQTLSDIRADVLACSSANTALAMTSYQLTHFVTKDARFSSHSDIYASYEHPFLGPSF